MAKNKVIFDLSGYSDEAYFKPPTLDANNPMPNIGKNPLDFSYAVNGIANQLDNTEDPDQATQTMDRSIGGLLAGLNNPNATKPTFKGVNNPMLYTPEAAQRITAPIQGMKQAYEGIKQIPKNPIAGALNTATGAANTLFGAVMTPYNIVSGASSEAGLKKPVELVDKGFEIPSKLFGKASDYVKQQTFDKNLLGVKDFSQAIGIDEKMAEEIFSSSKELGGILSTLATFGGMHKVYGGIKSKLRSNSPIDVQRAIISEAKDFSKNENWQKKVNDLSKELNIEDIPQTELPKVKKFKGFPIEDNYDNAFGKPKESVKATADPKSRLIVNTIEKSVTERIKKNEPIDEKLITDQINNVVDKAEQRRLGDLYNKTLEHNKAYYDKTAFKGFPIDDPYGEAFTSPKEVKKGVVKEDVTSQTNLEKTIDRRQDTRKDTDLSENVKKESQGVDVKPDYKLPKGNAKEKVVGKKGKPLDKESIEKNEITPEEANQIAKDPKAEIPKTEVTDKYVEPKATNDSFEKIMEDAKAWSVADFSKTKQTRGDFHNYFAKDIDAVIDKNIERAKRYPETQKYLPDLERFKERARKVSEASFEKNFKEFNEKFDKKEQPKAEPKTEPLFIDGKVTKENAQQIQYASGSQAVEVNGEVFVSSAKNHAPALRKAAEKLGNEVVNEAFRNQRGRVGFIENGKFVEKSNGKAKEVKSETKPFEDIAIKETRSNLPKPVSDKILSEAENMKSELASAKVEKGKSFFNDELSINGKFTINNFPKWFRDIQGDKKSILKALDKVIEDNGKDTGVMVERVKAKILEHLTQGKEDVELHINKGVSKEYTLGKTPPDASISEFAKRYSEKKMTPDELNKLYNEFDSETSFNFGSNVKETKPSQTVVKTKAGDQPFLSSEMAKGKALEPKNVKIDKGESGSPLFEQSKTDPSQISFGAGIGLTEFKQLSPKEISKTFKENTQVLKDISKVGFDYIKQGAKSFKDWSKRMIETFSEKIKPHLLKIWDSIKKEFGKQLLELSQKLPIKGISNVVEGNPFEVRKTTKKVSKPLNSFQEKMVDLAKSDVDKLAEEAVKAYKEKKATKEFGKAIIENASKIKRLGKDIFEPISTSVEKISPELSAKLKKMQFDTDKKLLARHKVVSEYLRNKSKSKITKEDAIRLDSYLKNGGMEQAKAIAKKYGFEEELNNTLKTIESLADEMGIKKIDNYFPRMVNDFEGFVKYLEQEFPEYWKDAFSSLIEKKAQRLNRTLTVEEQAVLINNALRGYNPGITLSDVTNMRKRVIPKLDANFDKFYANSDMALVRYVDQFTELAAARKFFGKGGFDLNESIGAFVEKMRADKTLSFDEANNLKEIMKSRFNQKPVQNRFLQDLKNIGIITKLGQPLGGTLTQLKDIGFSLYLAPRETIPAYLKSWGEKLSGGRLKLKISLESLGIDTQKIAHELADGRFRTKMINEVLSKAGFTSIDMIGKSTLINALFKRYTRLAKSEKLSTEFNRRIERYFGKGEEKAQVLQDLKEGKQTDSVSFLLYNELTGTQPITMMDLPKDYLRGGNWRVAYFLKTFAIRQLDFALNETVRVIKNKNLTRKERVQGVNNLVRLGATLSVVGAGVDQLKAYLMNGLTGKKNDNTFSDDVLDNLLNVALLSKYDYWNVGRSGLGATIGKKILPPMEYPVELMEDAKNLITGQAKTIKTLKNLPILGQFLYERMKAKQSNSRTSRTSRTTSRRTSRR